MDDFGLIMKIKIIVFDDACRRVLNRCRFGKVVNLGNKGTIKNRIFHIFGNFRGRLNMITLLVE